MSCREGLHLRAAGEVVKLARSFKAEILLEHGGRLADARSILSVVGLAVACNGLVSIEATGPDATEALDALELLFAAGFEPAAQSNGSGDTIELLSHVSDPANLAAARAAARIVEDN